MDEKKINEYKLKNKSKNKFRNEQNKRINE